MSTVNIYPDIPQSYCRLSSRPPHCIYYENLSPNIFWFSSVYKMYAHTLLHTVKFGIALILK